MSSSYSIVPYQPEFKDQVLQLQTQLWSPCRELNRAYFDWKYERNPYAGRPLLYLALDGRKVVAMRGFHGIEWEAGTPRQRLAGLYADDAVIDRGHRDRGLLARVTGAGLEDLRRLGNEYVFNLSAGPITLMASLSTGWRSAGPMRPLERRSWRVSCANRVRLFVDRFSMPPRRSGSRAAANQAPGFLARANAGRIARRLGQAPAVSFALSPRVEEMAALVERIGCDGRIRHVRDRAYLAWRFQNPLSRYGFLFCGQGGLEGYLVLQEYAARTADPRLLNIVDWEAASEPVLIRLLKAACLVTGHRKLLTVWSATLSRERLTLLAENGFRPEKGVTGPALHLPPLLVRALANGRPAAEWTFAGRRLVDLADWDIRMLYSMHG